MTAFLNFCVTMQCACLSGQKELVSTLLDKGTHTHTHTHTYTHTPHTHTHTSPTHTHTTHTHTHTHTQVRTPRPSPLQVIQAYPSLLGLVIQSKAQTMAY